MSKTYGQMHKATGISSWVRKFNRKSIALGAALLAVPAASSVAQTVPPVVISQVIKLGSITDGVLDGGQPSGTSIGVTTTGNIILDNTYGDTIYEINGTTGVVTTLGSSVKIGGYDPGPITVDSANNIYIAGSNGNTIVKVPVLSGGTYPAFTSSPPACTSSSTVECTLAALSASYIYGGYSSLAFDPSGNFYFVTGYNSYSSGSLAQNGAIWKCSAACLTAAASGTAGTAAIVYTDVQPTDGSTLIVGGLAIDSLGDIYFTDSDYNPVGNDSNEESSYSELKEVMAGASSATTLYTFTPGTVGTYDDELDAVAVDSSNIVYFGTQSTGIFAMLTSGGVANPAKVYAVSPQGAKALTTNGKGNFYGDDNTGSGDFGFVLNVGLVTATATTAGTPSTTTGVDAVLNSGVTCSNAPTTVVTSSNAVFSATDGTCATTGLINAPYIPLTVTFSPTAPGTQTATLTATGSGSGTAAVTGVATGETVATPTFTPAAGTYSASQSVTIADATSGATIYYTLNGTTPTTSSTVYTAPISVASSETIEAFATYAGSTNSAVATAAYTIQALTAQTITFTQPTSPVTYGVAPITLSATASSGLPVTFTVTSGPATVSGNTLTITGAGSVVVTASQAGNGTYVAATPVSRTIVVNAASPNTVPPVVVSQVIKLGSITDGVLDGGQPAGTSIGVTTTGNIILDNTYGDTIYEINGTTGVVTTLGSSVKIGGYDPGPITVDSANNIYIAGSNGNTIVKVPVLSGGTYPAFTSSPPACAGNDTVECTLAALSASYIYGGYSSLAFDPSGNFYFVTGYNSYSSGSLAQNGAIWKCSAACLTAAASGTAGTAAIVYTDVQPTDGSTLIVGGLAIDSLGDIYFTDSDYNPVGNDSNEESSFSDLKELPVGASSATTLYTFTPGTVGTYDDELDAVAVDSSNTVYFGTQSTGIFAMLTSGGVANPAKVYAVSPQGAKALTTNGKGNFYGDDNTGSGDFGFVLNVGLVTATATTAGTPSTTTGVDAVLNSGVTCSNAPTTVVTSSNAVFSATDGTCATTGLINAPYIPLTVTFSPTAPGTQTATLTATSNGSGTAVATGAATGGTVPAPTFTPAAGTYSASQSVTIADATSGATIYYTLNGTTPTTSSTVYTAPISVASSETIEAFATYAGSANSAVATAAYTIGASTTQTITFTQPTSPVTYGVAPITLSATASSGLPVTFTVTSGPATVSGNTLTITGAGSVVVTASQAGNGTYTAATPVSRTIVVNAASQTITFTAPSTPVTYSASLAPVTLSATASSGLAVAFTVTGPATLSGTTLTITGAGTITIAANQAGNTNYNAATQVTQMIVVNPASQTITFTAPPTPVIYGVAPIALSATASSGLAVTFTLTQGSSIASISGSTLTVTGAGTITVAANQAGNTNYNAATQVTQTIVVNPASQAITFGALTSPVIYPGVSAITLAATASSGLAVTYSVTGPATVSGSTLTITGTGTVSVTASQAGNINYTAAASVTQTVVVNPPPTFAFSVTPGSLTVQPGSYGVATVTVTPANGFNSAVSLACSGQQAGVTCLFSPASVTPTGTAAVTSVLTIYAPITAELHREPMPFWPGTTVLAAVGLMLGFRKRRLRALLLLVLGFGVIGMIAGCGSYTPPAPTTSTVTVTATSGATISAATVTLTVQ